MKQNNRHKSNDLNFLILLCHIFLRLNAYYDPNTHLIHRDRNKRTRLFYKNNLYKKHQADIRPKNKNNLRNKAGWNSNNQEIISY